MTGPAVWRFQVLLLLAGALLFLPGLGAAHLFDWDEVNFAEISREMMVLENYSQPHVWFLPFWQKPPLFFWLQVLSMKIFGITEFAARFPNALAGMVTLPFLYTIGRKLYDHTFGLFWALAYMGSLLPNLYFQSGIIDPVFNLFIFIGFWYFIQFTWKKKGELNFHLPLKPWQYLAFSGLFTGLAVLTKGPAALVILCLVYFMYWLLVRLRWYISIPQFLFYLFCTLLVSGIWYGTEAALHGTWFIEQFLAYNWQLFSTEDAGHGGFPGYHFVVVFIGCFPASVWLFRALFKHQHTLQVHRDMKTWMLLLFWGVLGLFSVVQSKILHYSSMTYFPLTYLAALVLWEIHQGKQVYRRYMTAGIIVFALLLGVALMALPLLGLNPDWVQQRINDPFARANLEAQASWKGWELITGLGLLCGAVYAIVCFRNQQILKAATVLFAGSAVVFKLAMVWYVPKIEAYTQGAAIEFYQNLANDDVYIQAVGFKTYADLYYAKLQPHNKPAVTNYADPAQKIKWESWLLQGNIDKPVFFVSRIDKKTVLDTTPGVRKLYEKNGFVFYQRDPIVD